MKKETITLVTICCLTYNHENTIAQALDGMLMQETEFPFEIIVHDDASTDGTTDIVKKYAEKYPDIVVPIIQKENQFRKCNLAKSYVNPKARGKYIAICEGDDYWTDPRKLQKQITYMESHPDCTMTFHAVEQLNSDGGIEEFHPVAYSGIVPAEEIIKRGGLFCPSVSLVFRRDVCEMWPEFRDMAQVYDFPLQILAAINGEVYYYDEAMGVYRFGAAGSWTEAHQHETDYAHMENEEKWLDLFNQFSDNQYVNEVNYHLAHIWQIEYRNNLNIENYKKSRVYAKRLSGKDAFKINSKLLFFRIGGKLGQKIFLFLKNNVHKKIIGSRRLGSGK